MNNIYIEPIAQERKYQSLSKMGAKLRVPIPECFLEMQVMTPDGVVTHHHKQRSHSWVRNVYNEIACEQMSINGVDNTFGAGKINLKDTSGTVGYNASYPICMDASVSQEASTASKFGAAIGSAVGIVVGTGTTAESFEDYILAALIAHGTAAGQLSYGVCELPAKSYDAGTKTYSVSWLRYFNNNSGGDISVAEVGIYARVKAANASKTTLVTRDLLGAAVVVPNSGQLKVTYTFSLVYPA